MTADSATVVTPSRPDGYATAAWWGTQPAVTVFSDQNVAFVTDLDIAAIVALWAGVRGEPLGYTANELLEHAGPWTLLDRTRRLLRDQTTSTLSHRAVVVNVCCAADRDHIVTPWTAAALDAAASIYTHLNSLFPEQTARQETHSTIERLHHDCPDALESGLVAAYIHNTTRYGYWNAGTFAETMSLIWDDPA